MWVYFLRQHADASTKIGFTGKSSPNIRRRKLQTGSGTVLELLAIVPGDRRLEDRLHVYFHAYRMEGEWFRQNPQLDELIEFLRDGGTLDHWLPPEIHP